MWMGNGVHVGVWLEGMSRVDTRGAGGRGGRPPAGHCPACRRGGSTQAHHSSPYQLFKGCVRHDYFGVEVLGESKTAKGRGVCVMLAKDLCAGVDA